MSNSFKDNSLEIDYGTGEILYLNQFKIPLNLSIGLAISLIDPDVYSIESNASSA